MPFFQAETPAVGVGYGCGLSSAAQESFLPRLQVSLHLCEKNEVSSHLILES